MSQIGVTSVGSRRQALRKGDSQRSSGIGEGRGVVDPFLKGGRPPGVSVTASAVIFYNRAGAAGTRSWYDGRIGDLVGGDHAPTIPRGARAAMVPHRR